MMIMTRHAAKTMGPTTGARNDASMKLRGVVPASVPLAPDVADAEVWSAGFISISHHAAHPCAFTSLPKSEAHCVASARDSTGRTETRSLGAFGGFAPPSRSLDADTRRHESENTTVRSSRIDGS